MLCEEARQKKKEKSVAIQAARNVIVHILEGTHLFSHLYWHQEL